MFLRIDDFNESYINDICSFFTNERELYYSFPKLDFPLSKENFRNAISKRSDLTTVFYDKNIAGFGNLYNKENECFIGNVIVSPIYRKKGVGRFLINELINIAKNKYKIKTIKLNCWCENSKGLLVYNSLGFIPEKILEFNKNEEKIPILQMMKIL